jgi:hypothetical protein
MSTITAEEWLRDYTKNERYRNTLRGVHAVRSLFDVLPDHTCGMVCPSPRGKAMTVVWSECDQWTVVTGEPLNLTLEYPSAQPPAPASAGTGGPA